MSTIKHYVFVISLWVGIFCRVAMPQISFFPVAGGGAGGSSGSYSTAAAVYTTATGTYYIAPGGGILPSATEAPVQGVVTISGAISNFSAHLSPAVGASATATFTWRKNGADTTVTCAIAGASATSCTDTSHSFNVVSTDLIDIKMVITGANTASTAMVLQWGTPGTAGSNGAPGAITTLQVNGVGVTTPATTNLQDSTTPNSGLSVAFTNPSAGNVKATITGTPALAASAITSGTLPITRGGTGVTSGFTLDGSGNLNLSGSLTTGGGPTITGTGIVGVTEATGQACASGADCLIADSVTHALLISNNNGTARPVASVSGALVVGNCLKGGANNTIVDNGAACGSGGGGGSAINTQVDGVTDNSGIANLNFQTSQDVVFSITPSGTTSTVSGSVPTTRWATRDQVQSGADNSCVPASASSVTYACNPSHALPAYVDNMSVNVKFDVNCASGSKTLEISSRGAKRLFGPDGTTDLTTSQCLAGQQNVAIYNGSLDSGNGGWKVQTGASADVAIANMSWPLGNVSGSLTATGAATANDVRYFQFSVPAPGQIVTALKPFLVGGASHLAWGIYDSSCNKLTEAAATGAGQGYPVFTLPTPYTLTKGIYYLATSSDGATQYYASNMDAGGYGAGMVNNGLGASTYKVFKGSNVSTTSGGVTTLPGSCGTRTVLGDVTSAVASPLIPGILFQ